MDAFEKKSDDDEWQVIANYWALQLRNIALGDPACARRTHLAVSKLILEAALTAETQQVEQVHIVQLIGSSQLQPVDVVSDENESISLLID